ncbi:MAG: Asp-tRNA(Asn)/Glu-tRNA(Gln) amidotransferase subunit GatC [Gammaproteobacteria bacterium]|nr:Asp-tRNA(Asn)/Glu-tRNA(Gln) amidotransferase subunit GatC [Gammaproteobacteria bacterium]
MPLTADDVSKIAHLARLNFSREDADPFAEKLSRIIAFIEQMNAVDTSQVEALSHPLELSQRLREDVVTEPNLRDKYQRIAPLVEAGFYLVPKVIE